MVITDWYAYVKWTQASKNIHETDVIVLQQDKSNNCAWRLHRKLAQATRV